MTDNKESIAKQGIKYVLVGIWNTIFGLIVYTVLIKIFGPKHYLLLGIPSNIIAVTNAYICYKFIVFKTKGNIIKEYLKTYSVYGVSMLCGFIFMYLFVSIFKQDAIISNIIVTLILTVISFLGHKYFSFKK